MELDVTSLRPPVAIAAKCAVIGMAQEVSIWVWIIPIILVYIVGSTSVRRCLVHPVKNKSTLDQLSSCLILCACKKMHLSLSCPWHAVNYIVTFCCSQGSSNHLSNVNRCITCITSLHWDIKNINSHANHVCTAQPCYLPKLSLMGIANLGVFLSYSVGFNRPFAISRLFWKIKQSLTWHVQSCTFCFVQVSWDCSVCMCQRWHSWGLV